MRENRDAAGGFFFSGMTLPPYRVGDTVNPGAQVIDVFDISGMEVRALVNEQDRANVEPEQTMQRGVERRARRRAHRRRS